MREKTDYLYSMTIFFAENRGNLSILMYCVDLSFSKKNNPKNYHMYPVAAGLRDVKAMGGEPVNKVSHSKSDKSQSSSSKSSHSGAKFTSKPPRPNSNNSKVSETKPKTPCSGCGNFHWKKDCPFHIAKCHACKKKGHLKKMCFESKSGKTRPKSDVHFASSDRHRPT